MCDNLVVSCGGALRDESGRRIFGFLWKVERLSSMLRGKSIQAKGTPIDRPLYVMILFMHVEMVP